MSGDGKVRRVDWSAGDWLGGTAMLSLEERGLYITACSVIYVAGGPVSKQDLRRVCPGTTQAFNRCLLRLIELGKLLISDGMIHQPRCERELKNAKKRLENSPKTSPFFKPDLVENNDLAKPHARAKVYQATNKKDLESKKGDDGRSAPSEEPLTAEERAELVGRFAEVREAINGPKVRDPEKRKAAITPTKRQLWLRSIDAWVSRCFDGDARAAAWEMVARAEAAGSRAAMTKADQRELDRLDELYRAESENAEPAKEAAD